MAYEQWNIRVDPDLDKKVRAAAEKAGLSLTAYVVSALSEKVGAKR
jgi:predicted HicB family RNase H-like nuclease